ncbi:MAG: DUF4114 domain-containing protein, partial [Synechococcaceae bacterium WB6_1B_055]|nr:DUF4114 domain-containing protein [Synechococcaceae bacterium WB6_1B_055]
SGLGQQQKFARPQNGTVSVVDSLGNKVGVGTVTNGVSSLSMSTRPAPGNVSIVFDGDPTSSYLINFKPSSTLSALNYGNWTGPVSKTSGATSITFASNVNLSVSRVDTVGGAVTFGITNGTSTVNLLNNANSANSGVLTLNSIYSGNSWQSSEGKAFGSATTASVSAGTWTPVATRDGKTLELKNLIVNGNNVTATYEDNITGVFTLSGTGTASNPGSVSPVLTVQRLGSYNNSLGFYEADSITGSVTVAGGPALPPGAAGYLQAALTNAKSNGLLLTAAQLPGEKQSSVINSLPLNPAKNYGLLLLVNGSETQLYSSYSAANPGGFSQFQSFGSNDRGLTIGIEDLGIASGSDRDFNDLIITIASSSISVI